MNRLLAVLLVVGAGAAATAHAVTAQRAVAPGEPARVMAPAFEVDPLWPKPLPNHWVLGSTVGVAVDTHDHVWIIHRPPSLSERERSREQKPPLGECCAAAPPVLEFDPAGNLVGHWGGPGPGYDWPQSNHGIAVDPQGNVWIGGNGPGDSQLLEFTPAGRFVKQFGRANARRAGTDAKGEPTWVGNSRDRESFGRPAKVFFDAAAGEAYVADGYLNRRVAVIDLRTGQMQRLWGGSGLMPDDSDPGPYRPGERTRQFRLVHCAVLATDGLVYVCDRTNDRIQVFRKDGSFVREAIIAPATLDGGSASDIALSPDARQTYLYVADLQNAKVRVLRRDTLDQLTTFGDGGRQPGQFYGVHSIATDSKGNIYTTETFEGKRVQKFTYRGIRPVARDQGVVWPASR